MIVNLFQKQSNAIQFKTQFGAVVAGVQSGKTFLGVLWAITKAKQMPTKNGIIVAPTYKILQQATLKKFFDIWPQARKYYKEQKGEICLPTGGTIFTRSADSPLGIEGITAHWAWLDEGGMASMLTWTVLRSRVSLTGGQILITTTPYNMGWLYTDFYLPWKNGLDDQLSFFTWRSIDNPFFDKKFFEAERKRLSVEEFGKRYEGEFRKMSGLIWDLPSEQIIESLPKNAKTELRIMGCDWGYRNPTGLSVIYVRDKCFYIVDEWKKEEKTTDEIIQAGNILIKDHSITRVFPDPAEPDRIEEAKRKGWPGYEASKDVLGGISLIKTLIKEKRLFVSENCKATLDEMSSYHWIEMRDESKEPKEEPEKINDHLCDALRYAIYSYEPVRIMPMIATPALKPYYIDLGI